jgi:tRNA splicing ligase
MQLADYLDRPKLARYIAEGWVSVRHHDTLPLNIYSYSRKTVYANKWDEITTKTRGLIVDRNTWEIVARPYEKFFAYDTEGRSETYPRSVENVEKEFGPPIITEKINGCLGTFYKYNQHWGIATKGSFHSPHATFATKWMEDHIEEHGKLVFPEGYTPVFEIICQEIQPHVIKYPVDGVVLLSLIKIDTGEEVNYDDVQRYAARNGLAYPSFINEEESITTVLNDDSDVIEGYVVTYNRPGTTPLKLKIKFPTFLANRRAFYEELKRKENPEIEARYKEVFDRASAIVKSALVLCTTRQDFAAYFNTPDNKFYAPACFALLDYDADKERQRRVIERLTAKLETNVNTRSREESAVG